MKENALGEGGEHTMTYAGAAAESRKVEEGFAQRRPLTSHMLSNSSSKSFACPHCAHICVYESTLKNHIMTHGEKPLACSYCSYTCVETSDMRCHVMTHAGERPHACPHCPFTTTQSSSLNRHLEHHTVERPLRCRHCSYSTTSNKGNKFNKHLTLHKM